MEPREELQAVLEVRDRLQQKFFHVQAHEVARTVDVVHHVLRSTDPRLRAGPRRAGQ
jgi:hypothetical protein